MPVKRSSTRGAKSRPPARAHPVGSAIGTLALLALGLVTFLFGKRSIATEYFEYANRYGSQITIGSLGFDDPEGFRILQGPDAIYWGIGFCAFGVMFGLWGCGIALSNFSPKKQPQEPSALGRCNTWLSFIALLIAILCLFPPWRLGSVFFYAVSALLIGSIVYSVRRNRPALPKQVVPGLIVAAILASNIQLTSVSVGIVLAMVGMLFVGIHVLLLAPHLMKLKPGEKEPVPSGSFDD
jgi:hypothetical protein